MAKETKNYQPSFGAMIPARALVDPRMSGLRPRLLGAYAMHDRMSLTRGGGQGCTAANKRLCTILSCDYTTLIKLRKELQEWGYILLEPRPNGKRLEIVRVIPDHLANPKSWPFDQCFIGFRSLETWGVAPEKIGQIANDWKTRAGNFANDCGLIVGEENSETRSNQPKTTPQYIPEGEKYNSSKEGKYSSSEEAHRENRDAQSDSDFVENPLARLRPRNPDSQAEEINTPEGGLTSELVLSAHLPRNFASLPLGAQVARLDAAYTKIGRDPAKIGSRERDALTDMLFEIFDNHMGGELDAVAQQAARLREDLLPW